MKILKYRMYGAGLSNQRMSLDMGVALSIYTGRAFAPYEFKSMEHSGRALRGQIERYNISDLFELPVPQLDESASLVDWSTLPSAEFAPDRLGQHVFIDETFEDSDHFQQFLGRRELRPTNLKQEHKNTVILDLSSRRNFCNVTPLFYVSAELRSKILKAIRSIIPTEAYQSAAKRIATAIGVFNAIHVRQGDFLNANHPFDIKDPEMLFNNVDSMFDRSETLVVCTDQEDSPNFDLVKQHFKQTIMLESYIMEEPSLRKIYDALPFQDEAIMGVLCQLICERAKGFAGSLRSTYTNYIHRARGEPEMMFINSLHRPNARIKDGLFEESNPDHYYSWGKTGWCLDVDPSTISWMREWPEVFD